MAKKVKKTKKKETVDAVAAPVESQFDYIERELNDLFKGLSLVNSRIDRIVARLSQSKSVKGL